jgi:putative endonuclease
VIGDAIARTVARAMTTDRTKELGRLGEELAAEHFSRLGYRVLARNHRTRFGELDLVAYDGEVLVFVEVKTRRSDSRDPWESLHDRKRSQVRRMAIAWLTEGNNRPYGAQLRFDGIAVLLDSSGALMRLDHLEAAF